MNITTTWRATAATVGLALAATGIAASASTAAPSRQAETGVDNTYLQDSLGLPEQTVIETVTYDRFQWLLRQEGQFAFVIGSLTDNDFKAQAQQVDAAAKAANVSTVYWFDPNLTGQSGDKSLDTRNPGTINLHADSQALFGQIWLNVIGQSLGNGVKSEPKVANGNGDAVIITFDDAVVNDSVDPAWDFREDTQAVSSTANVFFTFDKDHTVEGVADKIIDWVDLGKEPTDNPAEIAAAIAAVPGGGAAIDAITEFKWWQAENNRVQAKQHKNDPALIKRWGGDVLVDEDAADGWNVEQLTYPELLHVLNKKTTTQFAILFGGTWCPNTRAVIKYVNQEAVDNGVKVYNFDLVLDGGKVNQANQGTNPIHVRDNAYNSNGTITDFRPSWVYGDVVRTYFRNLVTAYDPHAGGSNRVSYFPGGNLDAFPDVVRKLQVPFLIGYERGTGTNPSGSAVKRQWIRQSSDSVTGLPYFEEYMTNWEFTGPAEQLGLAFPIPADESTLSPGDKGALDNARAKLVFANEAKAKLGDFFKGLPGAVVSTQKVTAPAVSYGKASKVTVAIEGLYGRVPSGNVTLKVNGKTYTSAISNHAAVFTTAKLKPGSYSYTLTYGGNSEVKPFTKTGTLTVNKVAAKSVKGAVKTAPTTKKSGKYTVTVTQPSGLANATGKVTVTLKKGSTTKKVTGKLSSGKVTVSVPKLAKGTWKVTVKYEGDKNFKASSATGKSVVVK